MSYILDALKKAEAERDPEARASLAVAQHQQRRNRWLGYGLVIALIANAVILLWLFLPDQPQPPNAALTEPAAQQQPASPLPETRQAPATVSPAGTAAAETQPVTMAAETATGEAIIRPGSAPAPAVEPTPVNNLPNSQRARFPELARASGTLHRHQSFGRHRRIDDIHPFGPES